MKRRGWREINRFILTVWAAAVCLGLTAGTASAQARIASLEQRFTGAERVVVAEARTVSGGWRQNVYGDRIIVTRVLLTVDETSKARLRSSSGSKSKAAQ